MTPDDRRSRGGQREQAHCDHRCSLQGVTGGASEVLDQSRGDLYDAERLQTRYAEAVEILAELRVGLTPRQQVVDGSLIHHSLHVWRPSCKCLTGPMAPLRSLRRKLFDIRPGEHLRTWSMFFYLLFVLFAYYILKPVSRAMFLTK